MRSFRVLSLLPSFTSSTITRPNHLRLICTNLRRADYVTTRTRVANNTVVHTTTTNKTTNGNHRSFSTSSVMSDRRAGVLPAANSVVSRKSIHHRLKIPHAPHASPRLAIHAQQTRTAFNFLQRVKDMIPFGNKKREQQESPQTMESVANNMIDQVIRDVFGPRPPLIVNLFRRIIGVVMKQFSTQIEEGKAFTEQVLSILNRDPWVRSELGGDVIISPMSFSTSSYVESVNGKTRKMIQQSFDIVPAVGAGSYHRRAHCVAYGTASHGGTLEVESIQVNGRTIDVTTASSSSSSSSRGRGAHAPAEEVVDISSGFKEK